MNFKSNATVKDNTIVNCSTFSADIFKQYGGAVETAFSNWLKGIITITNIQRCLTSSGEKLESGLNRNEGSSAKCPPTNSPTSGKITVPAKTPTTAESYVQYPSMFDENKPLNAPSSNATNWNLTKRTSVVERWQSSSQTV